MAGMAVNTTQKALELYGPWVLKQPYFDAAAGKKGKMLPRLQSAAGPHKDQVKDPHAAGLALDIVLFANVTSERAWADRIVDVFIDQRSRMGFNAVIYNGWEWNGSGVKFERKGDRHTTHIHIQWPKKAVDNSSFGFHIMYALWEEFQYD